ncbi:peptidase M17 [Sphingobacterium paramultivorum]|uniref:Peptidase M17 n=1 Tax=Sphingobacterium paramultivorum TaxID=2886510 RepID=A0A7G5E3U8_9SPHI|nr:M17 family peptidase N-terminal domain-containing protein [Sphingobacterium paramultivorum]QMV68673.1 peptidase M17 [Sphingobacterium paramultivorum]WSO12434.1 M17 family peptidase N-terminal domain-containing protein [Sphingobacterium paramultivorum]
MKTIKRLFQKKTCQWALIALLGILAVTPIQSYAQVKTAAPIKTTAIGTSTIWGNVDGLAIEGLVQGPSAAASDLQVACVFEYTEGDIFISPPALPAPLNGLVHLDEALHGTLTEIRKTGKFKGHALETILLAPSQKGTLASKKLLLIGLGKREDFHAELMKDVAHVAMREALRLGVKDFSFASDLKDAGVDSPTALVAENVVLGCIDAFRTQKWLSEKNMDQQPVLNKITLLAGPAFFETAGEGIKNAISSLNN